ncbi:MAG: hypothetical protein BroJett040_16260 [Oligoflexia bacterium]|nr:MAG: hypothetical protein BroJett040_16260 [Oligoflexia bacterium]
MKKTFIFIMILFSSVVAFAEVSFLQPVRELQISQQSQSQISIFADLSSEYVRAFSQTIRNRLMQESDTALDQVLHSNSCRPFIKVENPGRFTDRSESGAKNFEKSIFRVESLACLRNINMQKAATKFLSADFQKKAATNIKDVKIQGDLVCQKTYVFGLGKSDYCFKNHVFEGSDSIVIHSEIQSNVSDIEVPVYVMDSLNVFYQFPNETVFYSLVYIRGSSLNAFVRSIARGIVESTQQRTIELLEAE